MSNPMDDFIQSILKNLEKANYIKPDEIPNIELYMDQVTTFMDSHLAYSKRNEEDKILTKTMINNYAKNDLLPPPVKKKYSKEHILMMIFIYYFKGILSINDIQSILTPLTDKHFAADSSTSLQDVYQQVFNLEAEQLELLRQDIQHKYDIATTTFEDAQDQEFLQQFSMICMLCFDVYMKKQVVEKMIDQLFQNPTTKKADAKKAENKKADNKKADK